MHDPSPEKTSAFRRLSRYCFVSGLPRSGVGLLLAILRQNPQFHVRNGSAAEALLTDLIQRYGEGGPEAALLSDLEKTALFRAAFEAIFHDRPPGATVIDANPSWLASAPTLARIHPLCRFVFCVRNPAMIVNSISYDNDTGDHQAEADRAMSDVSEIGQQIGLLREALSGEEAERILVLDYDRLVDDPDDALDVIYDFLREEPFPHDFDAIGDPEYDGPVERSGIPTVLPTRLVLQLSGRAFWRNLRRTGATMLLGRAR